MKLLFLTANEQLDGGLLQSQMVRPVQIHFGDQAAIINLHRPLANRFRSDRVRIVNLPFLVPFRFINFRNIFFLNEIICVFYALAIVPADSVAATRRHPGVPGLCTRPRRLVA